MTIVEQLRAQQRAVSTCRDAADEIERLTADHTVLLAAARRMKDVLETVAREIPATSKTDVRLAHLALTTLADPLVQQLEKEPKG